MTYKVAIVGAGIGASHLKGYQALPERFQVKTVCDLDTARAEKMTQNTDIAVTSSFDDVLASDVDIIDICLPPHLHFSTSMQALDAGKHVMCEKPLVPSLAEADALVAKAESTGRIMGSVFQYRYGLGGAQMRALDAAGLVGKPFAATLETHWNRSKEYYDIDWRGTWAGESGGAILGHAIHIHDLLTSFMGPVDSIFAELATRVNDIEVEDCAALAIKMKSGAVVTSSVTLGAADDTSRIRILAEGMTVESDHAPYAPAAAAWTFKARAPYEQGPIDEVLAGLGPQLTGFPGLLDAFADTLDGRPAPYVSLEDGRASLEFVTAVYASHRSGQRMNLPLAKDNPLYEGWVPT